MTTSLEIQRHETLDSLCCVRLEMAKLTLALIEGKLSAVDYKECYASLSSREFKLLRESLV